MRSRNREVNIFNMSLLDILTGMLGAFLFLMLGLVPYYRMKAPQQSPSQPAGQNNPAIGVTFHACLQWATTTELDLYLYNESTQNWAGSNNANPLLPYHAQVDTFDALKQPGWEMAQSSVKENDRLLLIVSVPANQKGRPVNPQSYSFASLCADLLDTNGLDAAKKSYPQSTWSAYRVDMSRVKPGLPYAVFSFTFQKHTNAAGTFLQFNTDPVNPASDALPPGVRILPNPFLQIGP